MSLSTTKDTIFQDDNLHVSTYIAELDRRYGRDYLGFEPETLQGELHPTEAALDKIMAGITLKTTASFWHDITAFEKIALALNRRRVSFGEYQELSPGETAWAVVEAELIDDENKFSNDIKIYIAKILFDAGYTLTPLPLRDIQDTLDGMTAQNKDIDRGIQKAKNESIAVYIKQQLGFLLDELNSLKL